MPPRLARSARNEDLHAVLAPSSPMGLSNLSEQVPALFAHSVKAMVLQFRMETPLDHKTAEQTTNLRNKQSSRELNRDCSMFDHQHTRWCLWTAGRSQESSAARQNPDDVITALIRSRAMADSQKPLAAFEFDIC